MSDPLPDYYAILEITTTATDLEIKTAYKKAALKWHPDRVPVDSPERGKRTKKFQQINDAYYTLSDPRRRREYDQEMMADDLTEGEGEARRPSARFWAIAGTLSGAVLGFIVANVPGAAAGGAVGNRLGALRDKHKRSVYETFQQLPQTERNKLLTELAAKLFATALSG
ncbi:hypothetical protein DV738_g2659, partial [Chaetothyriales sp. CBS 135597]